MSTSIHRDVTELKELDIELKNLRKRMKDLKTQKQGCEQRIIEYLNVNDQPGLRMNGTVIIAKEKNTRRYQKASDKKERGLSVLEKYGIDNSQEALNEILEAMRGSPEITPSLKIY